MAKQPYSLQNIAHVHECCQKVRISNKKEDDPVTSEITQYNVVVQEEKKPWPKKATQHSASETAASVASFAASSQRQRWHLHRGPCHL